MTYRYAIPKCHVCTRVDSPLPGTTSLGQVSSFALQILQRLAHPIPDF